MDYGNKSNEKTRQPFSSANYQLNENNSDRIQKNDYKYDQTTQ